MQTIRINNKKVFSSIARAAKFLGVQRSNLSNMMRGKRAITYKDLLVEKMDTPTVIAPKEAKGRARIPVIVDGKPYGSCLEAEKALGLSHCAISHAVSRGRTSTCGHKIELVYPSMAKTVKKPRANAVKVECITTGVVYDNMMEASRAANADEWTMSKKMEVSGGFIDACGNEYRRLTPMRTKNVYGDTGKTVKKGRGPNKRKTPKGFITIDESLVMAQKPGEPLMPVNKAVKTEIPQIVKDAINDKIIQLLKEKGVYDDVIALLEYGGFTSVKFNTNKNN